MLRRFLQPVSCAWYMRQGGLRRRAVDRWTDNRVDSSDTVYRCRVARHCQAGDSFQRCPPLVRSVRGPKARACSVGASFRSRWKPVAKRGSLPSRIEAASFICHIAAGIWLSIAVLWLCFGIRAGGRMGLGTITPRYIGH